MLHLPRHRTRHSIDFLGTAFLSAGVTVIILLTTWGGTTYAWGSAPILSLAAAAVVFAALFCWAERRAAEPVIPLGLFAISEFSVSNSIGFIVGFVMFGAIIYIPLYLQTVHAATPTSSGLQLLPLVCGMLATFTISGRLVTRWGRYKIFPVVGTAVMSVGLFLFSLLTPSTPLVISSVYMVVLGAGIGCVVQVLVVAVQNAVSYADLGAATGGVTFFRSIGGSFGTATFGAVFSNVLAGNLATALHGLSLPPGVTAASGASPAQLAQLPAAVHAGYISGYATSLQTVFLVAVPFGVLAFALSWTLKDVPLRTSTGAQDPADTLAPTSRPTIRTSDQEMERALTALLSRERRREVYAGLVSAASIHTTPRAAWLLLRVGEHPGWGRHELAEHLYMTDADLERRLGELVASGYAGPLTDGPAEPVPLTETGQRAFDELMRARRDAVARLAAGWDAEHHPRLMELLTRLTHQLAASSETPGPDLDTAPAR